MLMFPISVLIFSFIAIFSSQLLVSTESSPLDSQKNVADNPTASERASEKKPSHPNASQNEFDDDDCEMDDEEDDIDNDNDNDDDDDDFFEDEEENDLDDDLAFEEDDSEDDDDDW